MKRLLLLLILLTISPRCIAQEADPFAGDSRLLKKHTIKAAGIPLKQLLEQLSKETVIQFTATNRVAQDKVVLYAHDRPLADSLRVISKFFNFYWSREGQIDSYAYTLSQSDTAQRGEAAEIEGEVLKTADRIFREVEVISQLARLSPEELANVRSQLHAQIREENDSAKRATLNERLALSYSANDRAGSAAAAILLAGRDRSAIAALIRSSKTSFDWPPKPGIEPVPLPVRERLSAAAVAMRRTGDPELEIDSFSADISGTTIPRPQLSVRMTASAARPSGTTSYGFFVQFPTRTRTKEQTEGPIAPEKWREIPTFEKPASITVTFPDRRSPKRFGPRPPFWTRVFQTLETLNPFDFIADSFHAADVDPTQETLGIFYSQRPLAIHERPLGEVLTTLAGAAESGWSYSDGFAQMRSVRFAGLRAAEPRISKLRQWAALPSDVFYSVDTLAEIADQSYAQFHVTRRLLTDWRALGSGVNLDSTRNGLIFWNALSQTQRQMALSELGLTYRSLDPQMRSKFELASLDRLAPVGVYVRADEREWPAAALDNARFRVEVDEREVWAIRADGGINARGGTREAAFRELRALNPEVTLDNLLAGTFKIIRIKFDSPGFRIQKHLSVPFILKSGK